MQSLALRSVLHRIRGTSARGCRYTAGRRRRNFGIGTLGLSHRPPPALTAVNGRPRLLVIAGFRNMRPEDRRQPDAMRDAATAPAAGSISFVITTDDAARRANPNLQVLRSAMRDIDEVIVLNGSAAAPAAPAAADESWFRVVTIPDASVIRLRAHLPAVCKKEWVMLLEDHSLVDTRTLDAIRELIRTRPRNDLIAFLGKNLTAVSPWAWANFLHTFALIWAPLDRPPPFSLVTATVVRRSRLETEAPLQDGVWELQLIPRIFSAGNVEYSNAIYVDHVKPLNLTAAALINFHNARAGAALQRSLGIAVRSILHEGWYNFTPRPRLLARAVAHRSAELPAGTAWRLHVIGFAHLLGNVVGSLFGGGRSAYRL
jgi:hypothetical protein